MNISLRILAVVLASLSGAAFAERAATEAEARYYIYSALLTQAAPGIISDHVVLGPELARRFAMPSRGQGGKVYEVLVSLSDGKPIEVRRASAEEVRAYGARPGLHPGQPLYAVDAGELKLLVQYDLQANVVAFIGERNTSWDAPKLVDPAADAAIPGFVLTSTAPSAAGATRPASTRLSWTGLFAFDSATLTAAARATLDAQIIAPLAGMEAVVSIDVSGHADQLGSVEYNQRLSEKRAQAVSDYLVSRGLDAGNLGLLGFGKTAPVKACREDVGIAALIECLAPNRRVVVEIAATPR
jgi:outer membrane protein OmpA-like peptidoglycan-associated protein